MNLNRRAFLQKSSLGAIQLGLAALVYNQEWLQESTKNGLPRATPESQGISSEQILRFVDAVEDNNLNVHSMMVLRNGRVVAEGWWEPYRPDLKHTLYSLSKSFTSTAIGMAVSEGRLKIEDTVLSFFPEDRPVTVSENLRTMRVKDLLTMSTGHDKDSTPSLRGNDDPNWVKSFLALPVEHVPGSFFVYNSGATFMLSAIIQKLTGKTVLEYLTPRLFEPLQITGSDWEVSPLGINTGGWGLRLKTEDIAKFGQLYLQQGSWNGQQLISKNWIIEATSPQIMSKGGGRPMEENDWQQGYCYQFWRCRHNGYRGDGAFGQYCIVMPESNLVIAITSETADMQGIMDQAWKFLLPENNSPLSADKYGNSSLKKRLEQLILKPAYISNTSPLSNSINGKKISLSENSLGIESVSLGFSPKKMEMTIVDKNGTHPLTAGMGAWKNGLTDLPTLPLKLTSTLVPGETTTQVAASATWLDPSTVELTLRFIETAHYEKIKCSFDQENVTIEFKRSLAILSETNDPRPKLFGKVIS